MKTSQISLLLIVALLFSCNKEDNDDPETPSSNGNPISAGVYVSGYEEDGSDEVTKIWKDGVSTSISTEVMYPQPLIRQKLNGLSVFNNDVYVAASELVGSVEVATYWKNGEKIQLGNEITSSKALSIYVTNEAVFVVGTEVSDDGTDAVLWRDGVKTILQEGTINTTVRANSVFVSDNGDVFVAGYQYTGVSSTSLLKTWKNGIETFESTPQTLGRSVFVSNGNMYVAGIDDSGLNSVAVIWKDSVATMLTDGANNAYANAVYVSGNDVFVAGVNSEGGNEIVTVWENGVATQLTSGVNPAYAHSIFVSEGDVYVVGYEWNGDNRDAMLWKNGTAEPLTDEGNEAIAYDVFVVE